MKGDYNSSLDIDPSPASYTNITEKKMSIFLNFLQLLKPLIIQGVQTHQNSVDKTIRKVANRIDFFLPFRQKAPMIVKAHQTIYSNQDRLRTPEGLWNILMYRGVLYGSPYATHDVRWFSTLGEWTNYLNTSTKEKDGEKEKYFVNICAYGFNNGNRSTDCITEYWTQRQRWTTIIEQNPDVAKVYDFLIGKSNKIDNYKKLYRNIGPLAALLICGDLVEAGVLEMPSVRMWAGLIFRVGKGAAKGLIRLNLVPKAYTEDQIYQAFNGLNNFLMEKLSDIDRATMGYNIIMLEHALCKFTRIYKEGKRRADNTGIQKRKKRGQ